MIEQSDGREGGKRDKTLIRYNFSSQLKTLNAMFKIEIKPNGPYVVQGLKKLIEETSERRNGLLTAVQTKEFEHQEEYHLCRCGASQNKPFCDGTHVKINFIGVETADKTPYTERAELQEGAELDLLDDERCAFARFCHRERGDVWTLVEYSDDSENAREAIEGACACPAGRLTAVSDGSLIEKEYEPIIAVAQDPEKGVSAGLYVRGDFTLEGADGKNYEKRNRVSLCRCGASRNKPFCDASHVSIKFNDKK